MAHLYRPHAVKPIPKAATIGTVNGKKVARWTARGGKPVVAVLTPDGTKCRVKSPRWWVEYVNHLGKRDHAKGFHSREATLQLAAQLEKQARSVVAGIEAPPASTGPLQLIAYLSDYKVHLAAKCKSERHRYEAVENVRRVIVGAKLTTPGAVDVDKVARWLAAERTRVKKGRPKPWSQQTYNLHVSKLKAFGNWLARKKKLRFNPFDGLETSDPEADRRHERRAIDHAELLLLVTTARSDSEPFAKLAGPDRAALYLVAAYVGFRASALARLTPESVEWADGLPFRVFGRKQKNGKPHGVPLHPDVAAELADWLRSRPAGQPLWSGWKGWNRFGARILRHDLERARAAYLAAAGGDPVELARREASDVLLYRDAAGEVFDFHSLRVQFVSQLAWSGVSQMAATELAGHSDPRLTAKVYARWGKGGVLAGEIAKLPGTKPVAG